MNTLVKNTAWTLTMLTGLGMVFIGARFFVLPQIAEEAYGIHIQTGDFSFHYIKGIRDIFSGLILVVLLLAKEFRALGMLLLVAVIIPAADFYVVRSHADFETARLYPHISAVVLVILLGIYYLMASRKRL